ncbi:phosphatidate cytidylyltransferase [Clostridiales bacterium oral taxon 876 str. F0540]|nr:phosphatidate cytidylyltransferase [Clostridiales bacterium oral taxon 876 str. F0540]
MNKRYLGALLISPFLIFLFLGGIYLKYIVMLMSLAGMYEYFKVSKQKNINPMEYIAYLFCIIYFMLINKDLNFQNIFLLIIFSVFMVLCIPVINTKYNFMDAAVTALGLVYVSFFFGFIVLVNMMQYGKYLIWIIFVSSWLCDTTAYYVGRHFGKNKLCPKVSPKKTIEGSIGGVLGSSIGCLIFGYVLNRYGVNIPLYHFILIGILCGIFGQFGDLVASSIKRSAGVKDYSNLIPGHGGILDRFDSILFSAVIVYYYLTIFLKL